MHTDVVLGLARVQGHLERRRISRRDEPNTRGLEKLGKKIINLIFDQFDAWIFQSAMYPLFYKE